MPDLYALLVGINDYSFKPLKGCWNDVAAMEEFLYHFYGQSLTLKIKKLTDENKTDKETLPTRDNLIKAFDHFNDIKEG
ncbi:MAG: caspase family protein, partial [Chitinophagaceae bacterium]